MHQHRNDAISILSLPPHVRRQVYAEAEILQDCFISLTFKPDQYYSEDRTRETTTRSLLLTCREVYDEVVALLYGDNHIYIRYSDQNSLAALRRLRASALRSLRRLTIHLNVASCGLGRPCDYSLKPWQPSDADRLDEPLSMSDPAGKMRLEEWHSVWNEKILPALSHPAKLQLTLVCDVADLNTGYFAVLPLTTMPSPKLLDFTIRLSHRRVLALTRLAQETVARAVMNRDHSIHDTDPPYTPPPFRFTQLPSELRHHILSYTDLITPYKEVEWNPTNGFYYRYGFDGCFGNLFPHRIHGQESVEYSEESLQRQDYEYGPIPRYISCWERSYPYGCFCQAYHAAWSSLFRCNCWIPPKDIFLVCRSVREDAMSVLYGKNRFVLVPPGGSTSRAAVTAPIRLDASIFLRDVLSTDALQFLRFLEIVFPPFGEDESCAFCPPKSPQWYEWRETLERARPYLDLPKLTIRAYFPEFRPTGTHFGTDYRRRMSKAHSREMCMMYLSTLAPLRTLQGLGRFFAYLAWPRECAVRWESDWSLLEKGRAIMGDWERSAERIVMGAEYDSLAAGKEELSKSIWLEEHEAALSMQ